MLERCRQLATAIRSKDLPVVLVRVERPGVAEQPPGSELVSDLAEAGDHVVVKRTIGAFYGTDLHEGLQDAGVTTLVLGGLVTTMGVESTARAASDHGHDLEFVHDAMSGLAAEEHQFAVERTFPRFGAVKSTADYL